MHHSSTTTGLLPMQSRHRAASHAGLSLVAAALLGLAQAPAGAGSSSFLVVDLNPTMS